ncbi:MAG: N-acetyltransferase, partial [Erysipelotrichia bacterium]|nr:N-acetyltransferase [Erysipelotrichia bacterium]
VLPDYRKQKVGEALLNAFISLTKERNKKGIVLTCKDHLIAYYEKFGFIFQGVSLSTHGKSQWNDMLLLF